MNFVRLVYIRPISHEVRISDAAVHRRSNRNVRGEVAQKCLNAERITGVKLKSQYPAKLSIVRLIQERSYLIPTQHVELERKRVPPGSEEQSIWFVVNEKEDIELCAAVSITESIPIHIQGPHTLVQRSKTINRKHPHLHRFTVPAHSTTGAARSTKTDKPSVTGAPTTSSQSAPRYWRSPRGVSGRPTVRHQPTESVVPKRDHSRLLANFRGISSLRSAPLRYSTFRHHSPIGSQGRRTQRTDAEIPSAERPETDNARDSESSGPMP
ncbi:hypothetical protein CBM2605_A190093 [Cupriavidus neocaledonicus]|uniref:Uncharacterized protein n=1 Tax=Cupriavidus neocaledonicus TaxID=1040979 RepID=A0ABY1UYS7_9BURK|nr:hypothetical protein CBM2605_A190093 [Cupriavidus neocaledonicus]